MMTSMRRTRTLASTAGAFVLLVGLTACGGDGGDDPRFEPIEQVVTLGDSYAAGPGINPIVDGTCQRSGSNYGSLVAKRLEAKNFQDSSCGGADTKDLVTGQTRRGQVVNQPQLSSVTEATDLVTLGIGLNNGGTSAFTLYVCIPELNLKELCDQYLSFPERDVIDKVDEIADSVKLGIESIRDLAPNTRVVLVGYPRELPDDPECPDKQPLTCEAADRLRLVLKSADVAYRRVAQETKIQYVSTYEASRGHDICSAAPWVNGIKDNSITGGGAQLHPTPAFMEAVAGLVYEAVPAK